MKIYCSCIAFLLINLVSFTSCGNSERQVKLLSDMYTHSGKLRGYAFVYEANGAGDYQMSDSTFPVYENEDYDNMSDEDWEQELNDEEDFDDEKVFE